MIVARISRAGTWIGEGSCNIEGYDGRSDGWFPVESFNFGFVEDQDNDEKDKKQSNTPPPANRQSGGSQGGQSGGGGGGGGKKNKKDQDFAALTIEKQIDTATCYLMELFMEERKTKKRGMKSSVQVKSDIHVLASVEAEKGMRFIYPIVAIHLQAVDVLEWSVKASGDGRPSESLKIRYDRAAMIYVQMKNPPEGGITFQRHGPKGWDQTLNEQFPNGPSGKFKWQGWEDFMPHGAR